MQQTRNYNFKWDIFKITYSSNRPSDLPKTATSYPLENILPEILDMMLTFAFAGGRWYVFLLGAGNPQQNVPRSSWKMQEPNLSACLMRKKRRKMSFWWSLEKFNPFHNQMFGEDLQVWQWTCSHKALNSVYLICISTISHNIYISIS